jgi:UPF0755 protein
MKRLAVILSIIFVVVIAAALIASRYNKTIHRSGVYFIIKEGEDLRSISKNLEEKGIIRSSEYFRLYARVVGYDKTIKSGNYILDKGINIKSILEKLKNGQWDFEIVTIPEGYTLYQIASRLETKGLVNKDKFLQLSLNAIDKDNLITLKDKPNYELEGYLFPDTYYIPKIMTETEIGELMLNRFKFIFNDTYRQRAKDLGLSLPQVITIASLIEREAANDGERKKIAGVIYNRIKKNMALQIDAAVIYAITKGEKNIGRLYNKDLKFDSKYNTYKYKGLPPGPIASPGKPSIEAALYPEFHDYLFYVLGEDGHVFSRTYQEHLKNVDKYIK